MIILKQELSVYRIIPLRAINCRSNTADSAVTILYNINYNDNKCNKMKLMIAIISQINP